MARTVTFLKRQPEDSHKPQDAKNTPGRDAAPLVDSFMEQMCAKLNPTPPDEMWKRIASLPNIQRGKVLNIPRQTTPRSSAAALGHALVGERACDLWRERGCIPDQAARNWYEAEALLRAELEAE